MRKNIMYESDIEQLAIEILKVSHQYEYIFGSAIAPDGEHPER